MGGVVSITGWEGAAGVLASSAAGAGVSTAGTDSSGLFSGANPRATSNSSCVNPFKTTIDPSSFSILVTGVPAKLLPTVIISVRNSLLVSRFFSSKGKLFEVRYSFSCFEYWQLVVT